MSILLAGKAEQIQGYLLASPHLHQIRGGSLLLVRLQATLRSLLEAHGGSVLCLAGGVVLAEFADSAEAERALREVNGAVSRDAPGLPFKACTSEAAAGTSFLDHRDQVLALRARTPDRPGTAVEIPFVLPCDLCHRRPARQRLLAPGNPRACVECWTKREADQRYIRGGDHAGPSPRAQIEHQLEELGVAVARENAGPSPTLDDLATGRPSGYIGYVAADGNALGERLRGLADRSSYMQFSAAVDTATREALVLAAKECSQRLATSQRQSVRDRRFGVLPVVAGGDDLLLLCSPGGAVQLAVAFAHHFEARSAQLGHPLSTGIGVVIAHASTPFGHLDEAAHALQKQAKALSRRRAAGGNPPSSALGFAVLRSGRGPGPEVVQPQQRAGMSAYLVNDPGSDLDASRLTRAAWELAESQPPWSRLKAVAPLLRELAPQDADREIALLFHGLRPSQRMAAQAALVPPFEWEGTGVWLHRETVTGHHEWASALPDLLSLAEIL